MARQLRLHGAAWGLCLALMLAGRAMAEDDPENAPQPHYTQDPIGDAFVGIFDNPGSEHLYYWPPLLLVAPVDINLDGRLDLLVSANYYRNGRQGQTWRVFIREDGGFSDLESAIGRLYGPADVMGYIQLFYESAGMRQNPESSSTSFFDVSVGGGGAGNLFEARIFDTGLEHRTIALLHAQDEEDNARIQSLKFQLQPLEPHVRFMNFGPLQERYAARLHREPMELERNTGGTPDKHIPIDYRDPVYADRFFDSPEEAYALLDGTATDIASSDTEQAPHFESVEAALEYYMKRNAPKWEPAPAEALVQQFGEGPLIATLEPWVTRSDYQERFFTLNSLAEVVRRSTETAVRQHFVEQILTGGLDTSDMQTDRDWLNSFAGPDFNAASRAFLLDELTRTKDSGGTYSFNGRIARWAGIADVEEALPTLREINVAQRGVKNWTHNPLFMRSALIALGRMGDPEAIREMIECVERVDDPKHRALSFQRLAVLRSPEAVNYLKRYLFSDVVHPEPSPDWLPVSEAQCAADTLRAMLEGFPKGPLAVQRKWIGEKTEYVFKPAGTEIVLPGLCR